MVFLNYSTMQMVAKIVYYGPGLCGKTTNLKEIYRKTSARSRGEMVSLETETDRTLFFDLLPMDVGVIGGFKTKFQLYTVPGQVFYNSTRKLVLRGVDGIVFVADSQVPMMEANINSFENLQENLVELGLEIEEIPLVFQYNKRDLPHITKVEDLNQHLNLLGRPFIESSALKGIGVFETLKEISKQTLLKLRAKALGKEIQKNREQVTLTVREDAQKSRIREEIEHESDHGNFQAGEEQTVVQEAETLNESNNIRRPTELELEAMPQEVSFDTYQGNGDPNEDTTGKDDVTGAEPTGDAGLPDVSQSDMEIMELEPEATLDETDEDSLENFGLDFGDSDELPEEELSLEDFQELDEEEVQDLDEEEVPDLDEDEIPDIEDVEVPSFDEEEVQDLVLDEDDGPPPRPSHGPKGQAYELDMDDEPEMEAPTISASFADLMDEAEQEAPKPRSKLQKKSRAQPKKAAISSSLKELETIATQTQVTRSVKAAKAPSVDALLSTLVGGSGKKKAKSDRLHMTVPKAFRKAQLNCVLLDEEENVVHTQLFKVAAHPAGKGKRQIRVTIDIEEDD